MVIPGANGCICSRCDEWHDVIFYDSKGKSYCLKCKNNGRNKITIKK